MTRRTMGAALLSITASRAQAATTTQLSEQVRQTEKAFAKTVADRDAAAFARFLSKDAVFMSGGRSLRGPGQVAEGWKKYFEGPAAPFSWEPEFVEVVDSGTLAMSSGPVKDPSGMRIGTFNSVWRREAGGRWKIVLDNGCPACDCAAAR